MKNTVFAAITSLLFLSSMANASPASCPSVSALQNAAFTSVNATHGQGYNISQTPSKYDTKDLWQFGLLFVPGTSDQDALAKANQMLQTMSGTPQPAFSVQYNDWYCQYSVEGNGTLALAGLMKE